MSEPTRLLDTPESELERTLLDAGRSYTASGSTRAKTMLALGLTAVAPSVAPATTAAGDSVMKAALAKVAVGVLIVGAVGIPVWRYLDHNASSAPVARAPVAVAAAPAAPAAETAQAKVASAELAPTENPRVEAAEPTPSSVPRNAVPRAESKPTSAPPLTAELAALDTARTALGHSDPAGALAALDSYAHDFPRGRLKIEAEVLRIGALAKSGQTEAARKRAEAFLRLHPDSVLASRVRSYAGL